jgi:hypothetical protein
MLSQLNTRDVDAHAAFEQPSDSAAKANVERLLPEWHAERQRLNALRIRRRETVASDRLVVGFVRASGISVASGIAILAGYTAYTAAGPLAALAGGAVALAVALAVVSWLVMACRAHFDRVESERLANVARLDEALRDLDRLISQAFLRHGFTPHARIRRIV